MKQQCFRHTGIDLEVMEKNNERWIQLSQDFYADSLQDLTISAERLRQDPKDPLSPGEVAACRAALGALQWLATQTQVHICARVNLLLTELTVTKTLQTTKEIQSLIKELRQDTVTLRLWHLPEVTHWQGRANIWNCSCQNSVNSSKSSVVRTNSRHRAIILISCGTIC